MTIEEYDAMFEHQKGKCAICRQPEKTNRRLSLDHCHTMLKNRELLCAKCNQGLGLFDDDAERLIQAATYIVAHSSDFKARRID